MKFVDLEPKFVRSVDRGQLEVDTIEEAQGVRFLCPKCFIALNGRVGTHQIVCWSRSRGVADDVPPLPGRWSLHGTGVHDLTLSFDIGGDPSRPSVEVTSGCRAHFHVNNGEITWS